MPAKGVPHDRTRCAGTVATVTSAFPTRAGEPAGDAPRAPRRRARAFRGGCARPGRRRWPWPWSWRAGRGGCAGAGSTPGCCPPPRGSPAPAGPTGGPWPTTPGSPPGRPCWGCWSRWPRRWSWGWPSTSSPGCAAASTRSWSRRRRCPIVAIAPLVVIWFGFGLAPKVAVAALYTFFPIVVGLRPGPRHQRPRRGEPGAHDAAPAALAELPARAPARRPAVASSPGSGSRSPTRWWPPCSPSTWARSTGLGIYMQESRTPSAPTWCSARCS